MFFCSFAIVPCFAKGNALCTRRRRLQLRKVTCYPWLPSRAGGFQRQPRLNVKLYSISLLIVHAPRHVTTMHVICIRGISGKRPGRERTRNDRSFALPVGCPRLGGRLPRFFSCSTTAASLETPAAPCHHATGARRGAVPSRHGARYREEGARRNATRGDCGAKSSRAPPRPRREPRGRAAATSRRSQKEAKYMPRASRRVQYDRRRASVAASVAVAWCGSSAARQLWVAVSAGGEAAGRAASVCVPFDVLACGLAGGGMTKRGFLD